MFSSMTCLGGFVCQSDYDECSNKYNSLVNDYNDLIYKIKRLRNTHNDIIDCVSSAFDIHLQKIVFTKFYNNKILICRKNNN